MGYPTRLRLSELLVAQPHGFKKIVSDGLACQRPHTSKKLRRNVMLAWCTRVLLFACCRTTGCPLCPSAFDRGATCAWLWASFLYDRLHSAEVLYVYQCVSPINMPWWPTAVASVLDVESSLASVSFLMLHPCWCVVPSFCCCRFLAPILYGCVFISIVGSSPLEGFFFYFFIYSILLSMYLHFLFTFILCEDAGRM